METIAARLQWVLEQTGLSARALSLKAGLAGGHVGLILRGTVGKRLSDTTIVALAKAGGVSSEWLARGVGVPSLVLPSGATPPLHVEHTERYSGRAEAERLMRGVLPDQDVDSVLAWDLNATEDPGVGWWIERMKESARKTKHWDKNPAAEAAELAKRRADGDTLETMLDGMSVKAAEEQRAAQAAEAANDPAPAAPTKPSGGKRTKGAAR